MGAWAMEDLSVFKCHDLMESRVVLVQLGGLILFVVACFLVLFLFFMLAFVLLVGFLFI